MALLWPFGLLPQFKDVWGGGGGGSSTPWAVIWSVIVEACDELL